MKCIVENSNGSFLCDEYDPEDGDLLTDSAEVVRQDGDRTVTRHEEARYGTCRKYLGSDIVESVFTATGERISWEVIHDADEDE